MPKFKKIRLDEITDSCLGKMLDQNKNKGDYYPYLANRNVRWGSFDLVDLPEMRFQKTETERYGLNKGDLLVCEGGEPGRCAVWEGEIPNMRIQKALHRVRAHEGVNVYYLFYWLLLAGKRGILEQYFTGTTIKHLPGDKLKSIEVDLPESAYQDIVVSVLRSLDKKIRINESINENLAEQAQSILYHFMDEYPYLLQPLSDIAIVIDCLHSKKPASIEDSIYQLIQLDNIRNDGFLDMSATKYMISQVDYETWTRKCEIVEGDCVITNVGRIGAVSQAPYGTKAAMGRNMTCIRLKPEIELQAYFITALLSNHMRRQIQSNTDEGTIMGALNVKNIPKLLFPIFEPSVMTELEDVLFPLRKQIEYSNLQNQTLAQLRDTLLPKLMSGEIDVSDLNP